MKIHKRSMSAGFSLAVAAVLLSATPVLGATWSAQTSGTIDTLKSVSFTDNCHGWSVGESAGNPSGDTPPNAPTPIIVTADGGRTWTAQNAGVTDVTLNRVQFFDNSNGWAVGEPKEHDDGAGGTDSSGPGTILRTVNGGSTWQGQVSPGGITKSTQEWEGLSFVSTTEGWIAGTSGSGSGGQIAHTSTGGYPFADQALPDNTSSVADVSFVDASNGWAIVDGTDSSSPRQILHTTNGGATGVGGWAVQNTVSTGTNFSELESIKFFNASVGVTVGDGGNVFWTTNGGTTWTAGASGQPNETLKQVAFVDATHLYVTTETTPEGVPVNVLYSADGGKTFANVPTLSNGLALSGVSAAAGTGNVWLVGDNGSIATNNATACPPPPAAAAVVPTLPKAGHPGQGIPAPALLIALLLVPAFVVCRRLSRSL